MGKESFGGERIDNPRSSEREPGSANRVSIFRTLAEAARSLPPEAIYTGELSRLLKFEESRPVTNAEAVEMFTEMAES
ncbi:hypothetical protein A3G06_00615 [Candidatus Nomurabacteria bacterium RIFCSPLOWO2_12_FULL_46_14]|uniref:Uncharacterized protein n=1 Tax=Candidatus Nomurabacteria bacterium RIFCSPLOWO2_12_FULL_46_14 TaxID=1801797 RepID=A0A1F6Y8P3_9BACT|nr:MAG: hypothetical protein A3G06_00615 [Candidatus Nomurabacteria bacterium RIFCSPLOWO2_12_FULL_46_14]HLD78927.1 hypothetical protein [Candidatus Nanoarchaeia archaeon]